MSMTRRVPQGLIVDEAVVNSGNPLPVTGTTTSTITSITMPTAVVAGQTAVTTAGTAVALGASTTLLFGVTIKGLSTNTDLIYVGTSAVDSSSGFELSAGETLFIGVADLASIYIDAAVNGEAVSYAGS